VEKDYKDYGFFGRGFYLTQYPNYGDFYLMSKAQGKNVNEIPLLGCWVLMGKIFPVCEDPFKTGNLHGQPLSQGYDSHFTVINKNKIPCKPGDDVDADELVLFSKEQALPRYLVYYKRIRRNIQNFPLKLDTPTLLWVDSSPTSYENEGFLSSIKIMTPEVAVLQMTSTTQLHAWFTVHHQPALALLEKKTIENLNKQIKKT